MVLQLIIFEMSSGKAGKNNIKEIGTFQVTPYLDIPAKDQVKVSNKRIKVVELFAGVGGFRLGLEGWKKRSALSGYKKPFHSDYEIVWSNQWEPSTKTQHASMVYQHRFGKEGHISQDITTIDAANIPDYDLLVGGFPCQDYSVAATLKNSKGLLGNKGVLWWSIHKILREKKNKPKYIFLENVDRLLISPSKQRGRDFAVILKSLDMLGYAVEWRVINAADYGMPQRRRRIFILAYLKGTSIFESLKRSPAKDWILKDGILAEAFHVTLDRSIPANEFELKGDISRISSSFNKNGNSSVFQNSGVIINGAVTTVKTISAFEGRTTTLKDIIQKGGVAKEFYIDEKDLSKWLFLKGAKKETRLNTKGFEYNYSEGGMAFPDPLDRPSRTIITGEGGTSASRFKHVIKTKEGFRRLLPIELERLDMFPDNHTQLENVSDMKRAFLMGNAVVVGVVEKIGMALRKSIK